MKTTAILTSAALAALAIPLAPQPARIPLLLAAGWLIAQIAILAHTWKHPLHGRAINWAIAGLAILTVAGAYATSAQALELGIQDDGRLRSHDPTTLFDDGHQMGAGWLRITSAVGETWTALKIRDAHTRGYKVILTIGGVGTTTRNPTASQLLAYIHSLPIADRYTVINEPNGNGTKPCEYRSIWMSVRRTLGHRLLFGDFSPHAPLSYTARMKRCGSLPKHLDFAVHPYQWTDPLAAGPYEAGIGNLSRVRRVLKGMGFSTHFWLTEFGYLTDVIDDAEAAWMWPRALKQARRNHARVLVLYTANGSTWNTRPGVQAWTAIRTHV